MSENISENNSDYIMKPKVDFAFKELMSDETVRVGFLAAVLAIPSENIRSAVIPNVELNRTHPEDKPGILDVRVCLNDETEIDIEIQIDPMSVWADRSLFYLSKMYAAQISAGDSYRLLKKCISISILDFRLFADSGEFYSCFHIREDTRHTLYTDKMEFHVIELPKLPEEWKENSSDLLLWAKFFNAERKEEFEMLSKKNEAIEKAYERLQMMSQDERKRMEYEAREKAIRDHNEVMLEATERGLARGIEIGKAEGLAEGMEAGERIGRLNALFDLVKDGTLTIPEAAKKVEMEPIEFEREYKRQYDESRIFL